MSTISLAGVRRERALPEILSLLPEFMQEARVEVRLMKANKKNPFLINRYELAIERLQGLLDARESDTANG